MRGAAPPTPPPCSRAARASATCSRTAPSSRPRRGRCGCCDDPAPSPGLDPAPSPGGEGGGEGARHSLLQASTAVAPPRPRARRASDERALRAALTHPPALGSSFMWGAQPPTPPLVLARSAHIRHLLKDGSCKGSSALVRPPLLGERVGVRGLAIRCSEHPRLLRRRGLVPGGRRTSERCAPLWPAHPPPDPLSCGGLRPPRPPLVLTPEGPCATGASRPASTGILRP